MIDVTDGFHRMGEENAFAVLARATALAAAGRDIVNLGIGQPDFPTPPHIVEAAVKALRDGAHGYTPAPGILPLREAVAATASTAAGAEISPERVLIVPGGKVTMFAAILMLGRPGVEILHPDPGFPIYRSMIDFTGATAVPIPIREENAFAFSAQEVLSLVTPRTRLVILNSPANPTGGVTPAAEVSALAAGLADWPDLYVLSDEIYSRMTYDGLPHVSLMSEPAIRDRTILLDGWSKTYAMTGWRLGWSVWPAPLFDHARKLAVNAWSCVNAATQHAGLAALTGPQDAVAEMMAAFDRRRHLVVERLNAVPNVSCVMPSGAFYAFANVSRTGWRSKELATRLLEDAGVALIGGPDFGTLGEGYIRVSYAASEGAIETAMDRLAAFLAENDRSAAAPTATVAAAAVAAGAA